MSDAQKPPPGTPGQEARAAKLIKLAKAEFGWDGLTEPERKVIRCAAIGVPADFTADTKGYKDNLDNAIAAEDEAIKANEKLPPASDRPVPDVKLSANVIRWLLADAQATKCVDPFGIRIIAAEIAGTLDLSFCTVPRLFLFDSCVLGGGFSLRQARCQVVSLVRTLLGKNNTEGWALSADRVNVKGDVFLQNGFRADGAVRLVGTTIGGNLDCHGGRFVNTEGIALYADDVDVAGSVFLRAGVRLMDGFRAEGGVSLLGSSIGGDLDCDGGQFVNAEGFALIAEKMDVAGSVFLRAKFRAEGEVRLVSSTIGSDLECTSGPLVNEGGNALSVRGGTVKGSLILREHEHSVGTIDLRQSEIGTLDDKPSGQDRQACVWPEKILLSGCQYGAIDVHSPLDAKSRLAWLHRHDETLKLDRPGRPPDPQPYRWLAEVLKKQGHEEDARTVLRVCAVRRMLPLAKQARENGPSNVPNYLKRLGWAAWVVSLLLVASEHFVVALILLVVVGIGQYILRKYDIFWNPVACWLEYKRVLWTHRMYRLFVGHGYARWRAVAIAFVLVTLGTLVFNSNSSETFQPTQARALMAHVELDANKEENEWARSYPAFDPVVYSVDTLIPLVGLQQEGLWTPSGRGPWGWFIKNVYLPVHIAMGWVIATLFVASFTKLMRQEG